MTQDHGKVNADHLRRGAYLYIRQSTLRQVMENTESAKRQYALRQRAVALGWAREDIVVIDCDQGHSGASVADREGFQKLVTEVGLGRAGIVMGLEVSRLARNSTDWHRLLEMCALAGTLILDEDGLYDPGHFNDRLLLGLKGTMSEAELHILRARLNGGILSKAKRGELRIPLPIGFVYDPSVRVVLDPDKQVQQAVRYLFETFSRTGSASATVRVFRREGIKFPCHCHAGNGDLHWEELTHGRALQILHNPRYTGAFVFGRSRTRKKPDGSVAVCNLTEDAWKVCLKDAHAGYITWEQYRTNKDILSKNAMAQGGERRKSPPREGPALLQGLVVCGKCGYRMTVRYHRRMGRLIPDYVCSRAGIAEGQSVCQSIPGQSIDESIRQLLIASATPLTMEVTFQVQDELIRRAGDAQRLRQQHVERARYEADQAKRRYMRVDPDNRLVADSLEALWNEKLRQLDEAQKHYEADHPADTLKLSAEQKQQILGLAGNFSRLWDAATTSDKDRKRLTRLFIEDVTLLRNKDIGMQVRFRGGATHVQHVALPLTCWQLSAAKKEVIAEIDRLLEKNCEGEIVRKLNDGAWPRPGGKPFTLQKVAFLRRRYGVRSRFSRLRSRGMRTAAEIARMLKIRITSINYWREEGMLKGTRYNEKGQHLYELPNRATIKKIQRRRGLGK